MLQLLIDQGVLNFKRLLVDESLVECTRDNENAFYSLISGKRFTNRLLGCNSQIITLALFSAKGTANDIKFLIPLLNKILYKKAFMYMQIRFLIHLKTDCLWAGRALFPTYLSKAMNLLSMFHVQNIKTFTALELNILFHGLISLNL